QKAATPELSFSANNLYTKTTKESTQITEKQDEHMLASNYSSDAEEEMLLNPETNLQTMLLVITKLHTRPKKSNLLAQQQLIAY
ncbi:17621_t:CDS:1, partial [Cetraspora pellucida]